MRLIRFWYRAAVSAYNRLNGNDGWAIASHIALSVLMALFPFLIVLTSIAAYFGTKEIVDAVTDLMLETWPKEVSEGISGNIHNVLTTSRGDLLTVGGAFAVYLRRAASKACASASTAPTASPRRATGSCCGLNRSAMSSSARSRCWRLDS